MGSAIQGGEAKSGEVNSKPNPTKKQNPAAQPKCKLRRARDWKLENEGIREGSIFHQTGSFCLAGAKALVCIDDEEEVVQVKAQQVTLAESSSGSRLTSTTFYFSSSACFCLLPLIMQFVFNPFLESLTL